jgi:hypothetical protein
MGPQEVLERLLPLKGAPVADGAVASLLVRALHALVVIRRDLEGGREGGKEGGREGGRGRHEDRGPPPPPRNEAGAHRRTDRHSRGSCTKKVS